MKAYAPVARFLRGRFSTNLKASGQLGDDFAPKLSTLDAKGLVVTLRARLGEEFKPLSALNRAVPAIPRRIDLGTVKARFHIDDGAIVVNEFPVKVKGLVLDVKGRHGLDEQMKYEVATELPASALSGQLARHLERLPASLRNASTVKVKATLTGSVDDPKVGVKLDTAALRGSVAESLAAEARKQASERLKSTILENRKLTAEARRQAARIRAEGKNASAKLKREGYKRADQLEAEGRGNPLKAVAAKEAAKRLRKQTDRQANQLTREANKRAEQLEREAKERAAKRLEQVEGVAD